MKENKMEEKKIKREEKPKKKLKNKQGITLIALVITIVVLLILAGVSIAMLTGNNGILTQAQKAKEETESAAKNETNILGSYGNYIYNTTGDVPQVNDSNPGVLEGKGTKDEPFVINSVEDLVVFADNVTKGNNYKNQYVKLGLSLDFNSDKSYVDPNSTDYAQYGYNGAIKTLLTSGEGFIPIGIGNDEVGTNSFSGTFDGQGNQIKNLYIYEKDETSSKLGFFSVNYGNIENLNLVNVNITRYEEKGSQTGGLVGQNRTNAIIKNCGVSGNIKIEGRGTVAGVAGHNMGKIEECYNLANITVENKKDSAGSIGGITTSSDGTITKCFNKGDLKLLLEGKLSERVVIVTGGISTICNENCIIQECYNTGNIYVEFNGTGEQSVEVQVGGITGSLYGEISNCYNTEEVNVTSNKGRLYVGGIAGKVFSGSKEINCYNVGNIQGSCEENLYIGGIVATSDIKVNNCYYLNQNNFTNTEKGAGEIKTEDEMKQESFIELLNQNGTIWKKDVSNVNNGYPILSYQ